MLLLAMLSTLAGATGLEFTPLPVPHVSATGSGDIDADGFDDVAWVTWSGGQLTVEVARGGAKGVSSTSETVHKETISGLQLGTVRPFAGDIDGDGDSEILVEYMTYDGSVTHVHFIVIAYASGGASAVLSRGDGSAVPLGDINVDGADDLAVRGSDGRSDLYLGGSPPTWTSTDLGQTVSPMGDIDGDGIVDIAIVDVDKTTGAFSLWAGGSSGPTLMQDTFASRIDMVGDIDGDGHGDAMYRGQLCFGHTTGIDISTGSCERTTWYEVDRSGYASDVDGDGYADVLARPTSGVRVALFRGGDPMDLVADAVRERAHPAGDINGDGLDDILERRVSAAHLYLGSSLDSDRDWDGFAGRWDCDDDDATIHPDAEEAAADGVDQDCDGFELCFVDADEDGYRGEELAMSTDLTCREPGVAPRTELDCDEADPERNPGATERVGDLIDQDCDGTELCYADADGDGFGTDLDTLISGDLDCSSPGEWNGEGPVDCDDDDDAIHPDAEDLPADGLDQDCSGADACYLDLDRDGARGDAIGVGSEDTCSEIGADVDCDDSDASVAPGADEIAGDGIDQDCDGEDLEPVQQDGEEGGCSGCSAAAAGPAVWLLMPCLALFARRRPRR